jgi:hypothetical protein
VKTPDELAWHISAVKEFFGEGLALRRRVFLGSANALCAAPERVMAMLTAVGRAFPVAPGGLGRREIGAWLRKRPGAVAGIYAFVDAWTGRRHAAADYREFARLGLRRVYLGLETGDPALLAWLGKPGSPDDAVELAAAAHQAGVSVGVVVLTGAGGERFFDAHVAGTADVLSRMQLREDDLLYLSELQPSARSAYRRRTTSPDLGSLSAGRLLAQRSAIATAFRPSDLTRPPRVASYDLREFVY